MSANRFGRNAKNLPAGLSASDLHRMLKHGHDVVGMGPSPAERGEAPLGSTIVQNDDSGLLNSKLEDAVEPSGQQDQVGLEAASASVDESMSHTMGQAANTTTPSRSATIDGGSTLMASAAADSTASSDGSGTILLKLQRGQPGRR